MADAHLDEAPVQLASASRGDSSFVRMTITGLALVIFRVPYKTTVAAEKVGVPELCFSHGRQDLLAWVSHSNRGRCLHVERLSASKPSTWRTNHDQQYQDPEGRAERHLRRDGQTDVPQDARRRARAG